MKASWPMVRSSPIVLGLLATACGGPVYPPPYTERVVDEPARAPVAATEAPVLAVSVDGAYHLPLARSAVPLPARSTGFVFVDAEGLLRVGKDAAYADARFVANAAAAAEALGLRASSDPGAPAGDQRLRAIAERTDLAAARAVVAIDRAAPVAAAIRLADGWPGPLALAVDGGALPFTLARAASRPGGEAARRVTLSAGDAFSKLVAQLDAAAAEGANVVELELEPPSAGGPRARALGIAIVIDEPRAGRGLDAAIIRRYVHRNTDAIRACAEEHLPGRADGTVTARFVIGPAGKVLDSTAAGSAGFDAVAGCIAGLMHDVEFPRPKGGVTVEVSYPITFRPSDR